MSDSREFRVSKSIVAGGFWVKAAQTLMPGQLVGSAMAIGRCTRYSCSWLVLARSRMGLCRMAGHAEICVRQKAPWKSQHSRMILESSPTPGSSKEGESLSSRAAVVRDAEAFPGMPCWPPVAGWPEGNWILL